MASTAIGQAGQPPPDIAALFRVPLCSCGYWRRSNGLHAVSVQASEQDFAGRRVLSGATRAHDPDRLGVTAGHSLGTQPGQGCQSVRIYAFGQCPRQDSNLRSRLRRGMLFTVSACQNTPPAADWGAYVGAQGTSPAVPDGAMPSTGPSVPGVTGWAWPLGPGSRRAWPGRAMYRIRSEVRWRGQGALPGFGADDEPEKSQMVRRRSTVRLRKGMLHEPAGQAQKFAPRWRHIQDHLTVI